ncbi:MAG TPA: NUDIX domain-containing protein [Polyangiaceae bacterium]|jgi:predicted NUDIX family NTP pyrophosphohydrolase|nr:NUDIX domain-containing protein [Polyangiaceae bacterium]
MAPKRSAGILLFRRLAGRIEVLLVHPGGPFWSKKDDGAWFIPKGELEDGEQPLSAARREFREELGSEPPNGEPLELGTVKNKSGKLIYAWALEGDFDLAGFKSNTFTLEWPPRSGKMREFPENDRVAFFALPDAEPKLHSAELPLLERLRALLAAPR